MKAEEKLVIYTVIILIQESKNSIDQAKNNLGDCFSGHNLI